MSRKNIAVVGANGKMGSLLCERLKYNFNVIKITENNNLFDYIGIDLVVDFASASSSVMSSNYCAENNVPLLVASTGQSDSQLKIITENAKIIPTMICPNLSVGVLFLKKIVSFLAGLSDFDVTIYEAHHKLKKDIPSGTALMLKSVIENANKNVNVNVNILSERGGGEVGFHSVNFYLENECISVSHRAFSRQIFASGAERAIEFLLNQKIPNLYTFEQIFDKN